MQQQEKVCASGKNGVIIGGVTTASERIEADVISNEKGIKTTIILRTQPDRIVEKVQSSLIKRHMRELMPESIIWFLKLTAQV